MKHYIYALAGQVVAVRDSGLGLSYLYGDYLGSISTSTSTTGQRQGVQYFDAWGKKLTGSVSQTKRSVTGQYLDDTGLLFYIARYYDPGIGRFVSADSIVLHVEGLAPSTPPAWAGAAPRPRPHPAWDARCGTTWGAHATIPRRGWVQSESGRWFHRPPACRRSAELACATTLALTTHSPCGSRAAGPARESRGPAGGPLARSGARSPSRIHCIVPGTASGGMAGVAYKPFTVDFHEPGVVAKVAQENQFGPWYTLSEKEQRQLGAPWGPANPQALNRYSYVLNAPTRWTDPSGHALYITHDEAADAVDILTQIIEQVQAHINADDSVAGFTIGVATTALGTAGKLAGWAATLLGVVIGVEL